MFLIIPMTKQFFPWVRVQRSKSNVSITFWSDFVASDKLFCAQSLLQSDFGFLFSLIEERVSECVLSLRVDRLMPNLTKWKGDQRR